MTSLKISALVRLFRFELPFAAGTCVVLGEILALGHFPPLRELALGFLAVFFISATSLILNDYFDLETDRINAPLRPLPSGLVTKREVVLLSIVVTLLGWTAAAFISPLALAVAVFTWGIGFLYNWRFKKAGLLGNLMVCIPVGLTLVFGGITVGRPFERMVWFFAALVLLIDLGEEIAADASDLEGDRQSGSRSLAVLYGRESAVRISAAIFLLVILISVIPFLLGWMQWLFFIPLALMNVVILFSVLKLLSSLTPNRRFYIRLIYMSGLVAILLFIFMRWFA
jgi:geranylgeranylglycerol-phosphate geranylgeranyltransferase